MDSINIIQTLLTAMLPISELRLAIPIAISGLGIPWYYALPVAIIGNSIPVFILVPGLAFATKLLKRFSIPGNKVLNWWMVQTKQRHTKKFERYGAIALIILVALPLPFTGAWTGVMASWVFQIPATKAILLIISGILLAGVIVTILTIAGMGISSVV